MDSRSSFRWTGPAAAPAIKNYSLQNEILLALAQSERAILFSKLECVPMEGSDLLADKDRQQKAIRRRSLRMLRSYRPARSAMPKRVAGNITLARQNTMSG